MLHFISSLQAYGEFQTQFNEGFFRALWKWNSILSQQCFYILWELFLLPSGISSQAFIRFPHGLPRVSLNPSTENTFLMATKSSFGSNSWPGKEKVKLRLQYIFFKQSESFNRFSKTCLPSRDLKHFYVKVFHIILTFFQAV